MNFEHRALAEPPEFRAADGGRIVATGIAIRYDHRSKPIGGKFRERIMPGAATKTLQEQDIRAYHEHDPRMLLGRTSSGTLRLADTAGELRYEIDLPDTTVGRDVAVLLERGDIRGSSFGFQAIAASVDWTVDDDGMALRTVGELRLDHVATTCNPAYEDTDVSLALRSLAERTDLDIDALMAAADAGQLPALLSPPEADDDSTDDGRVTPTVHRPVSLRY